ncbi:hypothetical protein [Sphingomonas sp. LT1P40]|uniref:hypothetical protein n=1 Tax=Alteristakelama amylovorans TaxID=3096166 RepID=UPI002FCA5829
MAHCPQIASPCPVADRLDRVMDGNFCNQCRKTVFDLDTMSNADRYRLMAEVEEPCVRYRLPASRASLAAAIMIVASVGAMPALAQDAPVATSVAVDDGALDEIIVGGARKLTRSEQIQMQRELRREERREQRKRRKAEKAARTPAT